MNAPVPIRLLVVEDHDDIRQALLDIFEAHGYQVFAVATGERGLEQLKLGDVDFVLTDWMLPGLSGPAMLVEALARGLVQADRALLMSARSDPSPVDGVECLRKPLDIDRLLALIAARVSGALQVG